VSHTLRIISHKLIWNDIIKYDLIKYILKIKDYNIINTRNVFLDLKNQVRT
jgi:hypothetical protein